LGQHHAIGVERKAEGHDAETADGEVRDRRIRGERLEHERRTDVEEEAHGREEHRVVAAGAPDRAFRPVRLLRAEALAHHRGRRIAQAPRRQQREDDESHRDGIAREGDAAEGGKDADQPDPARHPDHVLQRRRAGQGENLPHHSEVRPEVPSRHGDSAAVAEEPDHRVDRAGRAADRRRDRGAGDAESREWPHAEDEQWSQDDVDDVGEPEHAHRDRGVTGPAKDRVHHEQHDDRRLAAQHDRRIAATGRDHLGRRAHERQQPRREQCADSAEQHGDEERQNQRLRRRPRRTLRVLLADPPGHDRRRSDAQPHGERVDHREQRFGHTDRCDRIGAQMRDPEDVGDGEDALERDLEHHRHREQQDRAADGPLGEVVVDVTPDRLLDDGPEAHRFGAAGSRGRFWRVEPAGGVGHRETMIIEAGGEGDLLTSAREK
jgi:hypothetical protein